MAEDRRIIAHFTGHVQGVGFRYRTREIAGEFPVTGFVRNLADGRVELLAEGSEDELDRLVNAIRRSMSEHIRDVSVDRSAATGEFDTFSVAY